MKRGTSHLWEIVKYQGDAAIYARCKCGFFYSVSLFEKDDSGWRPPTKADPQRLYNYCPQCGARKTKYIPEVKKLNIYPSF